MKEEIETASRKLLLAFNNRCHQPRLACCFPFILNLLLITIFYTQPLIQQTWKKKCLANTIFCDSLQNSFRQKNKHMECFEKNTTNW